MKTKLWLLRVKNKIIYTAYFLFFVSNEVLAKIPKPPSDIPKGETNFIKVFWTLIKQGLSVAIAGLCTYGFITYIGLAWRELSEARRTGEWGNFTKIIGVGLVLLVITIVAANYANDIISDNPV